jgi:hypothetical protein
MAAKRKLKFKAGDRVILESPRECGIVVHTWISDELHGLEDCYVAIFGKTFPSGQPRRIPYVLRYAALSLRHAP